MVVSVLLIAWVIGSVLVASPFSGVVAQVNNSAVLGWRAQAGQAHYAAAKAGVMALTRCAAAESASHGVRVNAVAPGPVWTPLIPATMPEDKVKKFGEHVPMQEPAQPDDIAPSYVFFAAERLSRYYTGEVLAPIGGETLPG